MITVTKLDDKDVALIREAARDIERMYRNHLTPKPLTEGDLWGTMGSRKRVQKLNALADALEASLESEDS